MAVPAKARRLPHAGVLAWACAAAALGTGSCSEHVASRAIPPGEGGNTGSRAFEPEPAATAAEPEPAATAVEPAPVPGARPSERTVPDSAHGATCPADMALVSGSYCLAPQLRCADAEPPRRGGNPSNNCRRYAEPTTCFQDRRRPMRFCMDRFEWPNRRGELPRVLVSWREARELCATSGKRLCTEDELNFACEGEEMRPFVYGFVRDPSACNFDRPYRERSFTFLPWARCMDDAPCRAAFARIDQRAPAGAFARCRGDAEIHDLNGNVNEWVVLTDKRGPHRSGIKGGWWGPVRSRCRPTVTFHDEGDFGYEVGFRCCADAPSSGRPPSP